MPHKYLLKEFEDLARSATDAESLMKRVSQRIHLHIPRYNWVGFYLIDKKDPSTLVLGPHAGSFTPTPKITVSQGLCGFAATMRRTIVADNVAEEPNYIQASDLVKSQISVPVIVGAAAAGVFNVESYFVATFKPTVERDFVENCAKLVARCFSRTLMPAFANA
jgi:L-methionine (R)-S-oxide reductase